MHVYGQLKNAQFENATANPSSTAAGYVYWNTTNHEVVYYNDLAAVWYSVANLTQVQTLTNKKLSDSTTSIVDVSDPTKTIKFNAAGTTGTGTTLLGSQTADRILTLPDVTDTLATTTSVASDISAANLLRASSQELLNLTLTASVGTNALTIALKTKSGTDPSASDITKIGFRNATATTGTFLERSVTGALSVVVSSGSTLGHVSAQNQYVWVYAIDNAGTVELAVSGQQIFDEGTIQNTTAEGGAGAADSGNVLYSTTSRTGVAIRLIGRLKSSQVTAGTWASAVLEISLPPFPRVGFPSELRLTNHNGYGSGSTKIPRFNSANIAKDVGGDFIYTTRADDSVLGTVITIVNPGKYFISYSQGSPLSGTAAAGISLNSNQLTTSADAITNSTLLNYTSAVAVVSNQNVESVSWSGHLAAGDVIRPHSDGSVPATTTLCRFVISRIGD